MKRYEEYTPEEIEDLVKECHRMAEENSRLHDLNAELPEALKDILIYADAFTCGLERKNQGQIPRSKLEQAQTAIAKAEGKP
jgi:hypothetical protein